MRIFNWFKISKGNSLDRYYLLKLFGFGIFLHKIHHSDPPNLYHNHPWDGLSIILSGGGYIEERIERRNSLRLTECRFFNYIDGMHHRVVLPYGPVWTLFIHWPRCRQWSIVNDKFETVATEPWRGEEGQKDYANTN